MQRAGTEYKMESQEKAATRKEKETEVEKTRLEVGIYKRKTTKEVASQLKRVDQELQEAESNLSSLQNKKRKLLEEQKAVVDRHHENSCSIIDRWFNK